MDYNELLKKYGGTPTKPESSSKKQTPKPVPTGQQRAPRSEKQKTISEKPNAQTGGCGRFGSDQPAVMPRTERTANQAGGAASGRFGSERTPVRQSSASEHHLPDFLSGMSWVDYIMIPLTVLLVIMGIVNFDAWTLGIVRVIFRIISSLIGFVFFLIVGFAVYLILRRARRW